MWKENKSCSLILVENLLLSDLALGAFCLVSLLSLHSNLRRFTDEDTDRKNMK